MNDWKTIDQKVLLNRPPWVKVIAETLVLEDGNTVISDFFRVDLPDYVTVFAVTIDNEVVLVKQYRHAVEKQILELPAGLIGPSETCLDAAKRELLEETGFASEQWFELGAYTVDSNRGCGTCYAYLATNAKRIADPVDVDLQNQTAHLLTLQQLRTFWLSDENPSMTSAAIIGIGLAKLQDLQ